MNTSGNASSAAPDPDPEAMETDPLIWKDRSRTALKALANSVHGDQPIIVLTGPPGSGKTTFLEKVAEMFPDNCNVCVIEPPDGDGDTVMTAIAKLLGIKGSKGDRDAFHAGVRTHLFDVDSMGRQVVLIIDNGDDLSAESIQLLVDIAAIDRKDRHLARIILGGSSDLFDRLKSKETDDSTVLIDGISVPALTRTSSVELIRQELSRLSGGIREIDEAACASVYRETNGVPGAILSLVNRINEGAQKAGLASISLRDLREIISGGSAPSKGAARPSVTGQPTPKPKAPARKRMDDLVGRPDTLPKSIRESDDPQQLLRWAMGIKNQKGTAGSLADTPTTAQTPPPGGETKTPPPAEDSGTAPAKPAPPTPGMTITNPGTSTIASPNFAPPPQEPAGKPSTTAEAKPATVSGTTGVLAGSEQFQFQTSDEIVPERGYKSLDVEYIHPSPETPGETDRTGDEGRKFPILAFVGGMAASLALIGGLFGLGVIGSGSGEDTTAELPVDPIAAANLLASPAPLATDSETYALALSAPAPIAALSPLQRPTQLVRAPVQNARQHTENNTTASLIQTSMLLASLDAAQAERNEVQSQLENLRSTIADLSDQAIGVSSENSNLALQMATLQQQRDVAERDLLQKNDNLAELDRQLQSRREELAAIISELGSSRLSLSNSEQDAQAVVREAEERVAALTQRATDVENELQQARTLLDTLSADVETSRSQLAQQEDRISTNTATISEQTELLAALGAQREAAENALAAVNTEVAETSARLGELQTEVTNQTGARAATTEEISALEAEIATATTELVSLKNTLTGSRADLDALGGEISALEDRKAVLQGELDGLQQQVAVLNTRSRDLTGEVEAKADELSEAAIRDAALDAELQSLLDRADLARQELTSTQTDIVEARRLLGEVRSEIELALTQAPEGAVVEAPILRGQAGDASTDAVTTGQEGTVTALLTPETPQIDRAQNNTATGAADNLIPRDADAVARALSRAPGLGGLSAAQRQELETTILAGTCLTDALNTVAGTINRHTLAVLLRDLKLCSTN